MARCLMTLKTHKSLPSDDTVIRGFSSALYSTSLFRLEGLAGNDSPKAHVPQDYQPVGLAFREGTELPRAALPLRSKDILYN